MAVNHASFLPFPEVQPKPFNASEWKAWSIEDMRKSEDIRLGYTRRDMLDDLLAKYNFVGWTTDQVTNLLGPSNPEFCPDDWDIAYLLGTDFVDYVVLVLQLGADGRIQRQSVLMF